MPNIFRPFWSLFLALFVLSGCLNYADYSLQAYSNATSLKAKSLAMIDKSGKSYSTNHKAVEALLVEIDVAYEFSAGIKNNTEAADIWRTIRSEDEKLLGGFVALWRDKLPSGLSKAFRDNFKDDITFSFDRLICLEANKGKPTSCTK